MANIFNRNYVLAVQKSSATTLPSLFDLSVSPPFTIEFDIIRNRLSSANNAVFKVYNLSQADRDSILKPVAFTTDIRQITFNAGYGADLQNLPLAFSGQVTQCVSYRNGTDFLTEIRAFDAGNAYNNSKVNLTFPLGTPYQVIISALAAYLAASDDDVSVGFIDDFPGIITRGMSFTGNTIDRLVEICGIGNVFIDNGSLNCIFSNNGFNTSPLNIPVISSGSGLLNTPVLEEQQLSFEIIFNPSLAIGQTIFLQSQSSPKSYTSYYTVNSIHHKGVISGAVCGDATSTIECWAPKALGGKGLDPNVF